MPQADDYDKMLGEITMLNDMDAGDYTRLVTQARPVVKQLTERAVLLSCEVFDDEWLPLSQMRVNSLGHLYLATWLYEKKVGN